MNKLIAMFAAALLVACGAFAREQVTIDKVADHYPWDGKVDVTYTLSGMEVGWNYKGVFNVSAVRNGASVCATVTNDLVSANGTYTTPLDCDALFGPGVYPGGGFSMDLLNFPADATGTPIGILADVLVIDVSAGVNTNFYPKHAFSGVDLGRFNCDTYKTDKIVLRKVPAGVYPAKIGSDEDDTLTDSDTLPTQGFYIGVFPVTAQQYYNVMGKNPSQKSGKDLGTPTAPVDSVNWNMLRGNISFAQRITNTSPDSFLMRLVSRTSVSGMDLPTEAQWEIACRAGSVLPFGSCWDNGQELGLEQSTMGEVAWHYYNSGRTTHAVGGLKPNVWGLYDMPGNVNEWCRDEYRTSRFGSDADTPMTSNVSGNYRMIRGSSWNDTRWDSYPANRKYDEPDTEDSIDISHYGFRISCPMASVDGGVTEEENAITLVSVSNHVPWDGKVDCTLSGEAGRRYLAEFTLSVETNGVMASRTVTTAFDTGSGICTQTFDCASLFGAGTIPGGGLTVEVIGGLPGDATGSPIGVFGDVLVIDVSAGPNVSSYPTEEYRGVDMGCFNCDTYKTDKIVLRKVPAGAYYCDPESSSTVSRELSTQGFYIGVFPVTECQYAKVMGGGNNTQYPIWNVSWNTIRGSAPVGNAMTATSSDCFLQRLVAKTGLAGFDLPTEVQWEIACRAGSSAVYGSYWNGSAAVEMSSGSVGEVAWYNKNSEKQRRSVGQKKPNAWGLYDMQGNGFEWCRDAYASSFDSSNVDVPCSVVSGNRVERGASIFSSDIYARPSRRNYADAATARTYESFRLSKSISGGEGESVGHAIGNVVSGSGGWFATDTRSVKDTMLDGASTGGGGIQLRSSPDAWGQNPDGTGAMITWTRAEGGRGTLATATTADAVAWRPLAQPATYTLAYVCGLVEKHATFAISYPGTETSTGVPYAWLDAYYPDLANYEAGAAAWAANGRNTVREAYVAGLDPTNETSEFLATFACSNGMVYVGWTPNLNTGAVTRIYTVYGRRCLEKGNWELVHPWHKFFKVEVAIPTGEVGEESAVAGEGFVPQEYPASLGVVQLWKDGPYWAECNVGATKPEEYGYYFWWGDTVGYRRNANNDGWISVSSGGSFVFIDDNCLTYGKDNATLLSQGYIDSTGNLVAAHDAATAHLGAPWRMPTDAEWAELICNCTIAWINTNGVYGWLVSGTEAYSSKKIFFPAAGVSNESFLNDYASYGGYWSSTAHSEYSDYAWYLNFVHGDNLLGDSYMNSERRYLGQSVRPVRDFAP